MHTDEDRTIKPQNLSMLIERLAFRTWPAIVTESYGDWFFRASQGITKRANSVWTSTGTPLPEGDWLANARRFYASNQLPLLFHISDVSPPGLDKLLEDSGFSIEVPCSVLIADTVKVAANTSDLSSSVQELRISIKNQPDPEWIDEFITMEGFDNSKRTFYERMLTNIQPVKGFITLYDHHQCVAVATVVIEDGWAGIINVAVTAQRRGQGIGRTLLHQLALWSLEQGAKQMYLQVVKDNVAAWKLYSRAGFTPLFNYHYRREEAK